MAVDQKISELSQATSMLGTEVLPIVSGTSTKSITKANFMGGTNVSQVVGTTETQTLTNKTLSSPVLNSPSGLVTTDISDITASYAELNIMDGVTSSTAEINVLDGIPATLTATELGYVDGVTSAIQTQINGKQSTLVNSSGLLAALSDETGTGLAVFNNAPTITKPVINGTNPTGATYTPATGAQTVSLDCSANNMHVVTGHADGTAITFTVSNATNNQPFIVSILQGSGTVSTITGWFATVRWAGGATPVLTATLDKRDTFGFIRTGANTYDGFIIGQNA
jgi:hypothetical protein